MIAIVLKAELPMIIKEVPQLTSNRRSHPVVLLKLIALKISHSLY